MISVMNHDVDVHPQRGFLPAADPLQRSPAGFEAWDELGAQLPKLLVAGHVRREVDRMPRLDAATLVDERAVRRAMVVLSFLGHAYVWGEGKPVDRLPGTLAVSWHAVATRLGRPPVLSYASYALDNWRRMDASTSGGGSIALGNISLLQNFLGGIDEEWFVLVHVAIEAQAAPALQAIIAAQQAVTQDQCDELAMQLAIIADALQRMHLTLARMPERCDPYIYFNRVRPYIHGWKDQPALPRGLIYDGVEAYHGQPQRLRGETGAQSGIVPSLDAALGVTHADDPLRPYLMEMRDYMPPGHRAFVERIEHGPAIRAYVLHHPSAHDAYNACIRHLHAFRSLHLDYADRYIHSQSQRTHANPTGVGTGGTPFMPYLRKHRDETLGHLIE